MYLAAVFHLGDVRCSPVLDLGGLIFTVIRNPAARQSRIGHGVGRETQAIRLDGSAGHHQPAFAGQRSASMVSTEEKPEVAVADGKAAGKVVRGPEPVLFEEGLNVPVVDDATLRGESGLKDIRRQCRRAFLCISMRPEVSIVAI